MKSTPGSVQLQEGRVNYQEYFLDKIIDKALGELFFKTYYMLLKEFIIVEVPIYITTNRIKHTKRFIMFSSFLSSRFSLRSFENDMYALRKGQNCILHLLNLRNYNYTIKTQIFNTFLKLLVNRVYCMKCI